MNSNLYKQSYSFDVNLELIYTSEFFKKLKLYGLFQ